MTDWIYRPMQEIEFDKWMDLTLADYAEDLMINHLYSKEKAVSEAAKVNKDTLPQGINTKYNHFRICEYCRQTVGYIWFSLEDSSAFLMDIMLLPEYQGRGIGKQFMQSFLNELIASGAEELELRVSPHNQRALNMYKKLGFRVTGFDMCLSLITPLSTTVVKP
ncbi:GNAT family N-acetyltransferase [Serratia sp. NPDC078593]|uniref:GNAT family N-acetyltransferase n=1 Tax=unclassified Serratia (in: enterobacteria) TaxID=2647522 RepID=UPI0037CE5B2E